MTSLPQVVILAAGASSRFYPFNHQHKSLTTILGKPILAHTLESVVRAGLKDVIIVTSASFPDSFNSHVPQGLNVKFAHQSEPLGQADAILSAKSLLNRSFFVLNSQQFNFDQLIKPYQKCFQEANFLAATFRSLTKTPEKYGVFELDNDTVLDLIEKPTDRGESWRLVGTYFLTLDALDVLAQTPTSQTQLEEALVQIAKDRQFLAFEAKTDSPSLKYPWDLFNLKDMLLNSLTPKIHPDSQIAASSTISGAVTIDQGAIIHDYATIKGPAYIGRGAVVGAYSQVRSGTVLEAGATLQRYADAKNCLFLPQSSIHSGFVGDSIIGSNTHLGAGFISANKRLDRGLISISVKEELINTNLTSLGAFIGANTYVGVRSTTMPGTILGPNSVVGPGVVLKGTHPDSATFRESNV